MNHVDTTSEPLARRAINTAKSAKRAGGTAGDIVTAVQASFDSIGINTMYWAEDDSEGCRLDDFYGPWDLIVYNDGRDPVVVANDRSRFA